MQLTEQNQVAINQQLAFIADLRTAVGSITFLNGLLDTSQKVWNDCSNMETDEHLIRGIAISPVKTDACNIYISKMIKHYMTAEGARSTAWTKNTISSDNFTNKAVSSIIAATTFNDHTEMFRIVATRLMGFDDTLVAMALTTKIDKRAEHLVFYMASRFDMVENSQVVEEEDVPYATSLRKAVMRRYSFSVGYLQALLDTSSLTEAWYIQKSQDAISHFSNDPEPGDIHLYDHFDLLTQE